MNRLICLDIKCFKLFYLFKKKKKFTASSQESIVCELRCKSVYLGTGCGKSKENAKAVASREALKLFLKKKVVVKICKRKYRGNEIEDLVLLDEESRPVNLPPALKHPQELL